MDPMKIEDFFKHKEEEKSDEESDDHEDFYKWKADIKNKMFSKVDGN